MNHTVKSSPTITSRKTSSNSDRETAAQLPLPSCAALAQRGAVAQPAPWFPLLLRSSLFHLFAAAVVLLLRHLAPISGGQNLSTLGSCTSCKELTVAGARQGSRNLPPDSFP